jgi:cobyrinic acid a,c-diamide synthase
MLFSPLADDAPDPASDAVYLPGGYPELQTAKLAANAGFLTGLRDAAARGAAIYGECGGYMILGETLTDADGQAHRMAGLLPVETSFAQRKLHLGYRNAVLSAQTPLGPAATVYGAHEFHYASTVGLGDARPLFDLSDAAGNDLGPAGLQSGNVFGSFIHLIDHR